MERVGIGQKMERNPGAITIFTRDTVKGAFSRPQLALGASSLESKGTERIGGASLPSSPFFASFPTN